VFDSRIGFLGFGEAGYHLALGFREEGVSLLSAYDINKHTAGLGERIKDRAVRTDVELVESPEQLTRQSDIVLSVVTADQASRAASQIVPFLEPRHYFADLNSVSPGTKRTIAATISTTGARFVEAAVMAPVPGSGHKVPILLGGVNAENFAQLVSSIGMRVEVVSDKVGTASAVKMCRSIVVKGLEALLFECSLGAVLYEADERVFASLDASYPAINWKQLAGYAMSRVAEHGARRAREMEEVAQTLRAAGIEPVMSEAIMTVQDWGAGLELKEYFGGTVPVDYRAIVNAIIEGDDERKIPADHVSE